MKVSKLADHLDITVDTVRYYTRIGFLSPQKNSQNGYKEYGEKDIKKLSFIISARQLGFSINDIKDILDKANHGDAACPLVRDLLETRLRETENNFQQMLLLRERMKSALADWKSKPDQAPSGHMICHLIEEFDG